MVTAVVAAAGSGERLGAGGPKAFLPLAGRPMVEWSIEAFRAAERIGSIVIACPPGGVIPAALEGDDLAFLEGGETRSASVGNALEAVDSELVAIHDAARPLVDAALIEAVVETLLSDPTADAAIAATSVTDTIKLAQQAAVERTLDRDLLWAAQTPQVFRTEALRRALESYPGGAEASAPTDEAMLIEAAGGRVLIHPASARNLKVTTPLDMCIAELLLAEGGRAV